MRWTVVIPAKALPGAKSRLAGDFTDPEGHQALVRALRADTIAAARAGRGVARIVLVVDRANADGDEADEVLVQTRPGLNAALAEAAEHAATTWPADGVAALVGDLPALQPDELAAALTLAAGHPRAFVPDAAGTGTTLLTARPGVALEPRFGTGSAARHAAGAAAIEAGPGLRVDVDTGADLDRAGELPLGPRTRAVLATAEVAAGRTSRST